jgi:Fur family ferric uptake transcriptional regulator
LSEAWGAWPAGIKRTKQRERVLAVLERADRPISAAEIYGQTERAGEAIWLSTVYRILELFVKKGIVTKWVVMNSETALYEINRFRHKHYAVCISCHKIITMDNCPMERFIPKLEDQDFRVMGHNLELYGYCKDCGSKNS